MPIFRFVIESTLGGDLIDECWVYLCFFLPLEPGKSSEIYFASRFLVLSQLANLKFLGARQ